jgi:hypothetical protein
MLVTEKVGSAQRAFECRMLALRSRPSMRELLRIKAADEQRLPAYLDCILRSHFSFSIFVSHQIYNSQRHQLRETPVQDTVWDDAMVVMQAAVDEYSFGVSLIKNCCGRKKCI